MDYFVRQDTSHNVTRNGLSYATAWGGWGEISAATMAATDTLYVCGTHNSAVTINAPKAGTDTTNVFTLRGDYPGDQGIISLSGTAVFNSRYSYVDYVGLSILHSGTGACIFQGGTSSAGITYRNCTLTGGGSGIYLSGNDGTAHTSITITGSILSAHVTAGILWIPTAAGATATINGMIITENEIYGLPATATASIHLRTDAAVGVGSLITGLTITGNYLHDSTGVGLRILHGQLTSGAAGDIKVEDNRFENLALYGTEIGGGMAISGFNHSEIRRNNIKNVAGPYSGVDLFYTNSAVIEFNTIDAISSGTIDGNGILVDHGCINTIVRNNMITNIMGPGVGGTGGAGVMVLNNCTGIEVYGNIINVAQYGFWFASYSASPLSAKVYNNTIISAITSGIMVHGNADGTDVSVEIANNLFHSATGIPFVDKVADLPVGVVISENNNCVFGYGASENHVNGVNNIEVDPLLNGYLPSQSSPCVNAGVRLDPTWTDFYGHRFAGKPTIGAVEIKRTVCLRM